MDTANKVDWESFPFSTSPQYSHYHGEYYEKIGKRVAAMALRCIGKPKKVVEYGCGGGHNLKPIQFFAPDASMTGIEIYKETLDVAKQRVPGIVDVLIDPMKPEGALPKAEGCDLFICVHVIQHLPDRAYADRVIKLAYDSLVSSGVLLIQFVVGFLDAGRLRWNVYKSEEECLDSLSKAGFVIADRRTMVEPDYLYVAAVKP